MGVALAVVAGLAALVVVLFAWDRGRDDESTAQDQPAIEGRAVLSPRNVLFGDTVTALIEVILDRDRVDPDSVRVRADFTPWNPLANPERLRRDARTTTYLRTTFVLRCLATFCTSTSETAAANLAPARVTYTAREGIGSSGRRSLEVRWPQLVVGSRFSDDAAQSAGATATRWRADLLSLPAVSYGFAPGLLLALLLAGSTSLMVAAGALAYLALLRRPPTQAPQVDGPPEPVLRPLERAFALLEDPARVDGAPQQRRALEFVARGLVERGDPPLAWAARTLAWSRQVPGVEETSGLAVRARSAFGEELHARPE